MWFNKFWQNNNYLYICFVYMTRINYKFYVCVLHRVSSVQALSRPLARVDKMAYAAPPEYWLAWVPNQWRTRTLTCLLCRKEVMYLPFYQNGAGASKGHIKAMANLTYTSGIYYQVKAERAKWHSGSGELEAVGWLD